MVENQRRFRNGRSPAPPLRPAPGAPLVSVIVPCWNYGAYLGAALASIRDQTLKDVEIIVVDDGSTQEATRATLSEVEASGVGVLRQANLGVSAARNAGLREAEGVYVCCLDADDTMDPTYLEKCVIMLETNAGLSFAYSWLRLIAGEN